MRRRPASREFDLDSALRIGAGCVVSWLIGCVIVAAGLGAIDSLPIDGELVEELYVVTAIVGVVAWWGGSALAIRPALRRRARLGRRPRRGGD